MTKEKSTQVDLTTCRWLTEIEAARRLGLSVKYLQRARAKGTPPNFAKFGRAVRYCIDDIEAFERQAMRISTSDPGRGALGD